MPDKYSCPLRSHSPVCLLSWTNRFIPFESHVKGLCPCSKRSQYKHACTLVRKTDWDVKSWKTGRWFNGCTSFLTTLHLCFHWLHSAPTFNFPIHWPHPYSCQSQFQKRDSQVSPWGKEAKLAILNIYRCLRGCTHIKKIQVIRLKMCTVQGWLW